MIDRSHGLSLARQASLMRISRGSIYYRRKQPNNEQVSLTHSLDVLCMSPTHLRAQACAHADEAHVHLSPVLPASHQCSPPAAQDLSVPAEEQSRDTCKPSLGNGHHLCANAQSVDVFMCSARLVLPQSFGLATVQYDGCAVLRGCGARGY